MTAAEEIISTQDLPKIREVFPDLLLLFTKQVLGAVARWYRCPDEHGSQAMIKLMEQTIPAAPSASP